MRLCGVGEVYHVSTSSHRRGGGGGWDGGCLVAFWNLLFMVPIKLLIINSGS